MADPSYRHSKRIVAAEWRLALEKLASARRSKKWPRDAISHAYYAMFHAITAALLLEDIPVHTHAGAADKFRLVFIRSGQIPAEWSKVIERLFRWRMSADYEALAEVTSAQATEAIKQATAFLKVVKKLLEPEL